MIRRGWGVGAAVMAAAVLMTGCSGDPEPVVTPSPTPTETVDESPSPSASPSATDLTEEEVLAAIPEAARTEDFPGAEAFARYFLLESADALREGSGAVVEALSAPECVYCANVTDLVERMREEGVEARGGSLRLSEELVAGGLQENGLWRVELDSETEAREFVDADGTVLSTDPAQSARLTVLLTRDLGRWAVMDVDAQLGDA